MGRIVRSADFERVLATPPRRRSAHFAVHHAAEAGAEKLSTSASTAAREPVDEFRPPDAPALPQDTARWLGVIVPKRHARRAVTRSLLKRQMRAAAERHAAALGAGWWVVRLRAPFDAGRFSSAASEPLRRLARAELEALLGRPAQAARAR